MFTKAIKYLSVTSILLAPQFASAATSLACITPVSEDKSVEVRILNPKTGTSTLSSTLAGVATLNTSAITRRGNLVYFIVALEGILGSDRLVTVDLSNGDQTSTILDTKGIHSLYFSPSGQLRAFLKNPDSGIEEVRTIDAQSGSTARISDIQSFEEPQPGVMAWASKGAVVQISKNKTNSSYRYFKVQAETGKRISSSRLRFRNGRNVPIQALKRLAGPKNAQHAGVYYTGNNNTLLNSMLNDVEIARIADNGLVVERKKLKDVRQLVGGHTMVSTYGKVYVLGYSLDSSRQVLVNIKPNLQQQRVTLTDTKCALLKFGKTE